MTTTTAIQRISPRDGGRNVVWYRYTHNESATEWIVGPIRFAAGADLQAEGEARAQRAEDSQRNAERALWWRFFAIKGIDLDTVDPPLFSTLAQMRRWLLKELFNKMRADSRGEEMGEVADTVWTYLSKYSNAQIAGVINRPAWTAAKVGVVRGKLSDIRDAWLALDHGEEDID